MSPEEASLDEIQIFLSTASVPSMFTTLSVGRQKHIPTSEIGSGRPTSSSLIQPLLFAFRRPNTNTTLPTLTHFVTLTLPFFDVTLWDMEWRPTSSSLIQPLLFAFRRPNTNTTLPTLTHFVTLTLPFFDVTLWDMECYTGHDAAA